MAKRATKTAPILTLDQVLGAQDLAEQIIEVPEWGGAVRIRAFTKAQQHRMRKQAMVKNEVDQGRLQMLMVVNGIVEPQLSVDHVDALMAKSSSAIDRILAAIMNISGVTREAVIEAKRNFPDEPGSGVRVQPGGEAGEDGLGAAGADADG